MAHPNPQLHCPIRGSLKAKLKAKDGLTFTEEKRRIECINLLLQKGYPPDRIEAETIILRFGNKGKNSLRADVVVYDRPKKDVLANPEEKRRDFIKLVAEIKRDSTDSQSAKDNQLKPALELANSKDAIGIYWDDVEQAIFVKQDKGTHIDLVEASIAMLPSSGEKFGSQAIYYSDLKPAYDLVTKFAKLDDVLHAAGHSKDDRYQVLFKILLFKIFDEQSQSSKKGKMLLQDFSVGNASDSDVVKAFEDGLASALTVYGPLLPKKPTKKIGCSGDTLRDVAKILCPYNILGSSPQVIQDFFMYFGRFLYKVDLGQYFTPYEVIDLIVRIVNPKFGDVIKDPACGTADFLVGAKRVAQERHGADISAQLYGVDTSDLAVNLSVFNMILNGDGRSNISPGDSLKDIAQNEEKFTVTLCNPPFGSRIVEKRKDVLTKYVLGSVIADKNKVAPLKSQETGLLFVETCMQSVAPGGRIGIILPNGYLGNKSAKFQEFRSWLLRNARVAAVIGFPRFTFKKSGADVSASVVVLEKRDKPLATLQGAADFPIHFNLVEKVGWDLQSKRSGRVYRRDPKDGSVVLDEKNQPILDSDFQRVLDELYSSTVVDAYPWLSHGVEQAKTGDGWVIQASEVLRDPAMSLDPKFWCEKHFNVRNAVKKVPHVRLGDVLRPVTRKLKKLPSESYRYVEIEKIYENFGAYVAEEMFGWQLPDRGKLVAKPDDVFIANIWSSAGKWMIAGEEASIGNLVVTTGCTQFEVIESARELLPDLIFGLSSEAFRAQMRARATGSDGLSSIAVDDICEIVVPMATSEDVRQAVSDRLEEVKGGAIVLAQVVRRDLTAHAPDAAINPRSSHVVQV